MAVFSVGSAGSRRSDADSVRLPELQKQDRVPAAQRLPGQATGQQLQHGRDDFTASQVPGDLLAKKKKFTLPDEVREALMTQPGEWGTSKSPLSLVSPSDLADALKRTDPALVTSVELSRLAFIRG